MDLGGVWEGYTTQDSEVGLASRYHFRIEISRVNDSWSAYSTIQMQDKSGWFGVLKADLEIQGDTLSFREMEITDQQLPEYAYWCIKNYRLILTDDEMPTLTGNWDSEYCSGSGMIYLEKISDAVE